MLENILPSRNHFNIKPTDSSIDLKVTPVLDEVKNQTLQVEYSTLHRVS